MEMVDKSSRNERHFEDKKLNTSLLTSYSSYVKNEKNNKWAFIYKIILILIFFSFSLTFMFLADRTIFGEKLFKIDDFLQIYTPTTLHTTAIALYRFTLLISVFVYSITRNYLNVYFQKELIKKYLPWYILYALISMSSMFTLIFFLSNDLMQNFYLMFICVPLFLLNLSYSLYIYFLKRKSDPILYGRIWPTLVSLVAQFIILVVSIILVYMTVKATIYPNAFLENNIIFNFFKNLFVNKSAKNFVIVISLALLLGILAIAVNITRIQFLLAKQYTYSFFKDQLVLVLTYLAATFIWFIKVFTIKVVDLGIVNHKIEYFYLFEILFGLILTSLYLAITFKKKLQPNGASINSLIFSLFQMLLWVSLLVVGLHSNIQLVNALNIFFISVMSLTMLVVYLKKTNSITITEMIFLITFLIAMVLSMFIFGINQYLLSKSNNIFYIINSSLYITQIFLVLNVVIAVSFFMFSAIKLIVILLKISKTKEKLKETTYEKK
ncbi:hypothetical protein PR256_00260 [Metamycoplasma hyosynoviae]|uniref:MSC_0624 family F1-like ATPase-associated membrane protein n=2 Tax=Metamycoplasma hyosynoviae TaxID=29559 RepID=UPI002359C679|nr:hypothetical protein [Metamycoplasma hyosynoviae]MDC8916796.1 hypothetical protein [Metamycoplasma hyosynoviae]MDD1371457.1 hypothetical protein [Metamycoplasma hyosynoviae]MDD7912213.1 hypothetical protein [Metamycoplasma hyosynoviae]MDI3063961.1 hypothetical protein [Metamycoplasma hyosynoviae]